jgi:immunoglobulin-like protein involved in spore germination
MRPVHLRLLTVAAVLTVAAGITAGLLVGRDPVPSSAAATPTTLTTPAGQEPAAGGNAAAGNDPAPTDTTRRPGPTAEQAAKAAAVGFLRELGMRDPVAASYRSTGPATAEVGVHPGAGIGAPDRLITLVQLRRYANGWLATGATAVNAIEVDEPLPFARIQSPVTVSGLSVAHEGTLSVTVTEDRRGPDRVLGRGYVIGGVAELAPFSGPIAFDRPTGDAGWLVFSGDTGAAGIFSATVVRVRFVNGDHPTRILDVTTSPAPVGSSRLVTLTGSGTFTVRVKAFGADEVRVLLVPGGTGGRPHARLLGVDTRSEDGERWSVSWRYPDESFHGHLLVQANGRGGTAEHDRIAVLHE